MHRKGLKELVDKQPGKVLVELVTDSYGQIGRIIVLICIGIGCTAWFSFVTKGASLDQAFAPIHDYGPFFDLDYDAPAFKRLRFVEVQNVTENVAAMLEKDPPFTELVIPANGPTMRAVGEGKAGSATGLPSLFPLLCHSVTRSCGSPQHKPTRNS